MQCQCATLLSKLTIHAEQPTDTARVQKLNRFHVQQDTAAIDILPRSLGQWVAVARTRILSDSPAQLNTGYVVVNGLNADFHRVAAMFLEALQHHNDGTVKKTL